jgi:diguanylate cyclase (GGDEF)-like protein
LSAVHRSVPVPGQETAESSPWWLRTSHVLPMLTAAGLGVAVSIAAWFVVALWEDRHAKLEFDAIAENHFMVLQSGLNEYLHKLRALRALFDSSDGQVTRGEFETFAGAFLQYNSAIQTLSWVPRVLRAERAAHELAASHEGLAGYRIKAVAADRSMAPSAEQDEYFPIFYATVPKTHRLYGLDLRSEPPTLAELEQARDGDELGFSQVPALVTATGKQHGFIFSLPVYRQRSPHDTVEDRRRNLLGFVHGSFITAKMIGTIMDTTTTPRGVDMFFFEPRSGANDLPLHVHGSRLRSQPAEPTAQAVVKAGPHWSRELMAGNHRWMTLMAVPMPGGPSIPRHERAWIVLIAGLLLSAGLAAYMWSSGRHALRLVRANEKVSELARNDPLTALANRRTFVDRLTTSFAASRRGANPFAVLYFDLDHFKDVNDTLGHPAGDVLLRQVAERLKKLVRINDLVARFGGDEFAVLQTDATDVTAAGTLAAKIVETLATPYTIDGNQVHVTASVGISHYSAEVAEPEAIMMQADLALYRAKQDGRNCFRFHSRELDEEVHQRVTIADELRVAIRLGELQLHYQPQVELASGRIVGMEALVRWNHPQRGLVMPSVFIPVAERTGTILPLGQWVFDEACRQAKLWLDAGIAPQVVAVNLSAAQCKGSNLEPEICESLTKWGIPRGIMEIEVTESVLMEVTQKNIDVLDGLRQLGVRIAIDDFGTGYSSLAYLTHYPVNRLKIAQQLVFGVTSDTRNATVVRTAVRLARELGIDCVAEGVETEAQASFLVSAGCGYAQGYYFSRPITPERATERLFQGKIRPDQESAAHLQVTAA